MKPLRVEFDMTSEDQAAAIATRADHDADSQKDRGKVQRAVLVLLLFLTAVIAFDLAYRTPRVLTASMGCLIGAVIGLALRYPTRRAWRMAACRQVAAVLRTPGGKATLGPRSVEVSDDGIAIASGFARTLVAWRGVMEVVSNADHLVVGLPGPLYLCVPRRAFDSDHEFESFGETITDLATARGGLQNRAPGS